MSKLREVFETIMGVLVISALVILMMAAIAAVISGFINSIRIKQFDNYIIYQHEVYRKTELTEEVIKQIIDK